MYKLLFLLILSIPAYANEISISLYTDHLQEGRFHEDNQLVAWRGDRYFAATFINSYQQRTYAIGSYWEGGNRFAYGVNYGGVWGYCAESFRYGKVFNPDTCDQVLMPLVSPYVGYDGKDMTVKLLTMGSAVMVTVGFEL